MLSSMTGQLNVCLYGISGCDRLTYTPDLRFTVGDTLRKGNLLDIPGNLSRHITGLDRSESLLQYSIC